MLVAVRLIARWPLIAVPVLALVSLGGTHLVNAQNQNDVWRALGPANSTAAFLTGRLTIDPQVPTTLYTGLRILRADTGSSDTGMFKSIDGGNSWSKVMGQVLSPASRRWPLIRRASLSTPAIPPTALARL